MFESFRNTISSISGFVGAAAVSSTNDAAESGRTRTRSPRPSRSPAASHRAPAAMDLTEPTSPRRTLTDSSPNRGHRANLPVSPRRSEISPDDARRASGIQRRRPNAKPIPHPNPYDYFVNRDRNMKVKPGASHAHHPTNTLHESVSRAPGSAQKRYGSHSNSTRLNSLIFDQEPQFGPQEPCSSSPPTKKRRTEIDSLELLHDRIDDDDVQETRPSLASGFHTHTSRPTSLRSAGNGRVSLSSPKFETRSEFHRTSVLSNPHRKKPRAATGNSKVANGDANSSPILLDDDEPTNSATTSKQLQFQSFQQGAGGSRDISDGQLPETVSRHFPPKMNHSTSPLRGVNRNPAHESDKPRHKFKKGAVSIFGEESASVWPLKFARTHNYEERGADIFLRHGEGNEYHITSSDPDDIKHTISFTKVNQAWSDHTSHTRLKGPVDSRTNSQYIVDLEFADKSDQKDFETALIRSITNNSLKVMKADFMTQIFAKRLEGGPTSPETAIVRREQPRKPMSGPQRPSLIANLVGSTASTGAQKSLRPSGNSAQGVTPRGLERPVRTTRATQPITLDVEEEPEVEKYSQIYGLGQPWKRQLNYGSGRHRAVVDFNDLLRLDNGEYLNDQLIDFYLLYLLDQSQVSRDKVYIFNTHFFTTLTRKVRGQKALINYQGVARWTSKDDIFGYDYIVVPINQDLHWYLAIICNVSNIARVPSIADATPSRGASPEQPTGPDGSIANGPKAATMLDSAHEPALVDMGPQVLTSDTGNEVPDQDDAELNLVDSHAHGPGPADNGSGTSSTAAETERLDKLSLNDGKAEGILPSGTSAMSASKKMKRKSGPPPRKWDPNQPVIIVLDSLGSGARSQAVRVLKEYISEEGKEKRGMEAKISQNACYARESQIPMQENLVDCGVYLLGYAQKFFEDPDSFKDRLLSGEMQLETDWPHIVMPEVRNTMRDILQNLYKKQEEEREQARKGKKSAKKDNAKHPLQENPVVGTENSGEDKVVHKAATMENSTHATVGESPPVVSQPQPRLASPFEPQPAQKRDNTPGTDAPIKVNDSPVPEPRRHEAVNGQHVSPTTARTRKGSPKVVVTKVSPLARASPKRTLVLENDADEIGSIKVSTPRRVRADANHASTGARLEKHREPWGPPIAEVRPPDPSRPKGSASRRPSIEVRSPDPSRHKSSASKYRSMASSPLGVSSAPARGSSHDPIPIDDSQEAPPPNSVKRRARPASEELDVVMEIGRDKRHRTHSPVKTQSPVKLGERGSPRRGGIRGLIQDQSFPGEDLDLQLALEKDALTGFELGSRRSKWRSSTPDKGLEVPETPSP